jgi:hypothetical protein
LWGVVLAAGVKSVRLGVDTFAVDAILPSLDLKGAK